MNVFNITRLYRGSLILVRSALELHHLGTLCVGLLVAAAALIGAGNWLGAIPAILTIFGCIYLGLTVLSEVWERLSPRKATRSTPTLRKRRTNQPDRRRPHTRSRGRNGSDARKQAKARHERTVRYIYTIRIAFVHLSMTLIERFK